VGKLHYFGKIADDPDGQLALAKWLKDKDALLAGLTPRVEPEGLPVRELIDRFMVSMRDKLGNQEITPKHFAELYGTCRRSVTPSAWTA